jgi:PAS domain S-box-containing protein
MKECNYKAYNIIQHMRYWEGQGEDPAFLFKDTGIDYQKIMETDWLDFESQVYAVWKNLFKRVPNPEDHFFFGYDSYKNKSMGALETIGRLASLKYIFKLFPIHARNYSLIERFSTHRLTGTSVVLLYWPVPKFVSLHSLYQQSFLRGLLCAIPKIYQPSGKPYDHSIPDANVTVAFSCVDLTTVFKLNYKHLIPDAHCEYTGDLFLVNGKPVARKVMLGVEKEPTGSKMGFFSKINKSRIYCAKKGDVLMNLPNELSRKGFAYEVMDDFLIGVQRILSKGDFYNAPYTRYNISWQKVPFLKRARFFLSERPEFLKNSREQLLEQLDIADQRYAAEMKARKLAEEKEKEARRIKEALAQSEARYRLLADNVSDNIWIFDIETRRFSYMSPSVEGIIGFTAEEATGFRLEDLLTQSYLELANKVFEEELTAAVQRFDPSRARTFELEQVHKTGSTVWTEVVVKCIYEHQQPTAILGVTRDISERKRLQDELLKSQKMESLGLLAGGVAHDLNNVLSGIVSYPELILMNLPADSKLQKPMKTIMESGNRAVAIVQDLLTIARGVAVTKVPLNLNDLISDYLDSPEFNKLKMFYPDVIFNVHLDKNLFHIDASDVHIRKMVMNLVANATEAVKQNGSVSISTENRCLDNPLMGYEEIGIGEYAVLSIVDNGLGISPKDLERIFEPFYTKKKMGRSGTGLGLSIVWNVIRDHNGHINVKTDENGTMFEFYFRITRDAILEKDIHPSLKSYKGNGEMILVVDDIDTQREISCRMMDILGYKCKAFSSGEAVVEYLEQHSADLVLLDMIMDPGINGYETYERISRIHPRQKAIILSGFSKTDDVKKAQSLGVGQYVIKPVSLEKLGIAIKEELKK